MSTAIPTEARTIGQLRASGYKVVPIREELRRNLIQKIRDGQSPFPNIYGYEDTVLPQIENAILAGQDMIFLGERGQAKTRISRSLINLLDEVTPIVAGSEINDDPFSPISRLAHDLIAEHGDDAPITWLPRERRYGEKLATPDTTISDLIGEVDPIKVAEGRYLSDELTLHYGLIPRTNRGIFCLNELPDLAERIQVGLLNIMEERDVQVRGYKIQLPLDIYVVASANPEDYTNRGRIITPLKDRYGSQIRTHYPKTIEQEIEIIDQESARFDTDGYQVAVPRFMKEVVAEVTHLARRSSDINQRSGVSVRLSIANYENLTASALKRAIRLNEKEATPRISDLPALVASTMGKIELESAGDGREDKVVDKLIQHAVVNTFARYFNVADFEEVIRTFENGRKMEASPLTPSMDYVLAASQSGAMKTALEHLGAQGNPSIVASGVEFVLEGLHLNRKLNKDRSAASVRYRR
ncbi:MAG: Magnesium chelatase, subunit ChlI [uncultured Thermomicrobiales bacterium]|uniref:Magnesium chelatase, subunit ChlI n=1 Tax=uncultured Thermomicrobiales bacterium TaxID=1645740 RepID=A0A6J4UYJ9_9BACT|nr:MAG: Magnesium chelatase, subunit ChlI [uncultured Thermomicrobiales bacterium]